MAHKGSIAFKPLSSNSVDFGADLKIMTNLCSLAKQRCKTIGNKIYDRLRSEVRRQVVVALNTPALRDRVAQHLKSALGKYVGKNWTITKVTSQGGNFVITLQKPYVIGGKTVSIKDFKVKQAKATMSCPGKIGFSATIHARHAVAGKAWLEYLAPKAGIGPKRNWSMGKKGSVTSTITQAWNEKGSGYTSGKTRLVVSWKGSNGKTYTRKSAPVTFQRRCSPVISGPGTIATPPARMPLGR